MVTTIKLGLLNVLVRTHSFITRYIEPLFKKARKQLINNLNFNFMNKDSKEMKQGKVINHKSKVAFAQSKVCKAFAIVKHQSQKYIVVMGDNQLSERQFDTIKQAEEFIARKPYELIINAAFAAANFIINQQKQQNNEKNN